MNALLSDPRFVVEEIPSLGTVEAVHKFALQSGVVLPRLYKCTFVGTSGSNEEQQSEVDVRALVSSLVNLEHVSIELVQGNHIILQTFGSIAILPNVPAYHKNDELNARLAEIRLFSKM